MPETTLPTTEALDQKELLKVLNALKKGDFDARLPEDHTGLSGRIYTAINEVAEQQAALRDQLVRLSTTMAEEGRVTRRLPIGRLAGGWAQSAEAVNNLLDTMSRPYSEVDRVISAVARGDLTVTMPLEVDGKGLTGSFLQTATTINRMVEQLNSFAGEVTRVAREVGTEGKLGGQARVEGVSGTWKDLTESVNGMADNLTSQVRNIAEVTKAVANGDLSRKITVDVRGEVLELKETINTMVDQLSSFASEVVRVAREVGTEGKLGGQARVEGVSGTWRTLTDTVNQMASNLTLQVRNIAEVTTAVANGDLSRKITVDVQGEVLELKQTINIMVDQLNSFAGEVTRVAREVGTEGKLGGQARVGGVSGIWRDLTENVNQMAANLTLQVRNIAEVTTAVANGNLSRKITVDVRGEVLELKETINRMVDQLNAFASEVTRVALEVGTEGKLGGQARVEGVSGTWKGLTESVNGMADNLTLQVRNIAEVTTAVANGDLSRKITVDVRGEVLELKETINRMVDQLNAFAGEVTRVAREVGTEGKLGGQARVEGVSGTWKDLTESVNGMADNLTLQVRNIAEVTTAVANGDLSRKITVDVRGEVLELKQTINRMVDQLNAFANEVTRVAREVGSEGKLGGQARVEGVSGTWRDLTNNVNELAATLTRQIRAISDVTRAVTAGDLTQSIDVEAAGEVALLKDQLNQMISTLGETTRTNQEQDWLKTNVARLTRLLQGQRELQEVTRTIISELARLVNAQHGAFYLVQNRDETEERKSSGYLQLVASYAYRERKGLASRFQPGEGIVGQCFLEGERILITDLPDDYVRITSGLGSAAPRSIVVLPVLFERSVQGVVELASFHGFSGIELQFLDEFAETLGIMLNTIAASQRTQDLLSQSQQMAEELQKQQSELQETNAQLEQQTLTLRSSEEQLRQQQEELQQTNEELEEKAQLLAEQYREIERKNSEVEVARQELEEKAEQLSMSSRYKSEFVANMSHELRTPLNSMLILSRMLAENREQNLNPRQVEFAETIHASGIDLLGLINEILDLSKIEAGKMDLDVAPASFEEISTYVHRTFDQQAIERGLDLSINLSPQLPPSIVTDGRRLQQVLRNLLSNALKFTEKGKVELSIAPASGGWSRHNTALNEADRVIAFAVQDTGIGIPPDRLNLIFEAFQQADGSTSRRFGGTGLGLSISRKITELLGGEIRAESKAGEGSRFTLYLPYTIPFRTGPGVENGASREEEGAAGIAPSPQEAAVSPDAEEFKSFPDEVGDDRGDIGPEDIVLLIVEDDLAFARVLLDRARSLGFKGVVSLNGSPVVEMARTLKPHAITLDLKLKDMDGHQVLDALKKHPATRHIPVHVISGDEDQHSSLQRGALSFLQKPATAQSLDEALRNMRSFVQRKVRRLLVAEDDATQAAAIRELLADPEVDLKVVRSGKDALEALRAQKWDCMVLDLGLPDMAGTTLLNQMRKEGLAESLPVIVYTGRELTRREETALRRLANSIILKDAGSPERLLEEATLFLHRVESELPAQQRQLLAQSRSGDAALTGGRVLIVDDDIRNVFALTSLLEEYGMKVAYVESGPEAIEHLESHPIDVVLMDIMLPGMDGFETIAAIRKSPRAASIPIIALTAKAMKGDRERCIAAGANDYVSKPVDADKLLSLLRIWCFQKS